MNDPVNWIDEDGMNRNRPGQSTSNDGLSGGGGAIPVGTPVVGGSSSGISLVAGTGVSCPIPRSDVTLSGGRSGSNVKNLTGPANSIVNGTGNRIYVTDGNGRVILDITAGRVKPVTPGEGFGPKRPPTPQELEWYNRLKGK